MDFLIKKLKEMTTKRILSKKSFEIFSKFPEEKLQQICAIFMNDIIYLTSEEVQQLYKSLKNKKEFENVLKNIKQKLSTEDFTIFKQTILYTFSKFFGYFESHNDKDKRIEAIDFLINYIFIPSLKILTEYEESEKYINQIKSEICSDNNEQFF